MNKFLDHWETFCKTHALLEKAIELENEATYPELQARYEQLDRLRLTGIISAEKCHKLKMGGIPWSPEL